MMTKKLISALMGATLLSTNVLAAPQLFPYDVNGDGTTEKGEEAYELTNADDLYWFAGLVNGTLDGVDKNAGANAYLAENIVVNENLLSSLKFDGNGNVTNGAEFKKWFPIGLYDNYYEIFYPYNGVFDGNGKTISGLYFNISTHICAGLFGNISNSSTIKNLGVIDSYFLGDLHIGGVCGKNKGTIENCYNVSNTNGIQYIGGLCGMNEEGSIKNCYNTGEVSGSFYIGGVTGYNQGTMENCYNASNVNVYTKIGGGLCGECYKGSIKNCYNSGSVNGSDVVSDVCALEKEGTTIENCYVFKLNGGTMEEYSIVVDNDNIALPTEVLRNGYTFDGWYVNEDLTGEVITSDGKFEGAKTRHAKWVKVPTQITEENRDDYELSADYIGYYALSDADDLYWFAKYVNKGGDNVKINAFLAKDIIVNKDLLESLAFDEEGNVTNGADFKAWFPVGYNVEYDYYYYKGTFDGNGHTISGLFFDYLDKQYNMGLFGDISKATIKNLGVIDSYFSCSVEWTLGGICGYNNGGTIENCFYAGELRGYTSVGGVCGQSTGTIEKCYNTSKVYGSDNYVGGVCGYNMGTITNCYNTGEVNGNKKVGGVCGRNRSGYTANCYNTGKVSGGDPSGVCGYYEGGTLTNCYFLSGTDANATLATAEQFANGTVAKALRNYDNDKEEANKIGSDIWGQTIGKDPSPVFSGKIVEAGSTAIKAVEAESNKTIKTIKDGQIVIIRDGVMYDMQGRKL